MNISLLKKTEMRTNKVLRLLMFILLISSTAIRAQSEGTLPSEITEATRNGDAIELANYFNNKIELVLPSNSGVFSKQQAQFMLKDFFNTYPPTSFQLIHQGVRENATFAIGRYSYSKGKFRFVFLTKNEGSKALIHQLRIEQQDE